MRKIRYQVACSLDGYIAVPNDEHDWIVMDPDIDFQALLGRYDTVLMGRRSFELFGGGGGSSGMTTYVFSRTLRQQDQPGVTIVADGVRELLQDLRASPGKDIWLFGGGELFKSLLELDCVDTVEPAIVPVVLGGGRPLLPTPAARRRLALTGHEVYPKTGTVILRYDVMPAGERAGRRRR